MRIGNIRRIGRDFSYFGIVSKPLEELVPLRELVRLRELVKLKELVKLRE